MSGDILRVDVIASLSGLEPQQPATAHRGDTPASPAQLVPAGLGAARRFRVVGNLPYNISAPILFRLIDFHRRLGFFADATLMLQREVAARLVARAGTKDYGVLTVMTAAHATVTRLLELPPGAFIPAPKVHSTVVRISFGGVESGFERGLVRPGGEDDVPAAAEDGGQCTQAAAPPGGRARHGSGSRRTAETRDPASDRNCKACGAIRYGVPPPVYSSASFPACFGPSQRSPAGRPALISTSAARPRMCVRSPVGHDRWRRRGAGGCHSSRRTRRVRHEHAARRLR